MGSTVRSMEAVVPLLLWASDLFVMVFFLSMARPRMYMMKMSRKPFVAQMPSFLLNRVSRSETLSPARAKLDAAFRYFRSVFP